MSGEKVREIYQDLRCWPANIYQSNRVYAKDIVSHNPNHPTYMGSFLLLGDPHRTAARAIPSSGAAVSVPFIQFQQG